MEKHLLTDEQAIREMVQDDRSLARRILDWLDGLLLKFTKRSQERQFVLQARDAYRRALQESYKTHEMDRLQQAKMRAYAEGDDAAGDAIAEEQWATEGYVDRLLDDRDVADVEFSIGKTKENRPFVTVEQASITEKSQAQGNTGIAQNGHHDRLAPDITSIRQNGSDVNRQFSVSEETGEIAKVDPVALYQGKPVSQNEAAFRWENLISLPDMKTVTLPDVPTVREAGKVNTAKVIENGMKNALSVGKERAGKVYVTNRYTGRDLRIDVSSIRHGLDGGANRVLTNARLGSVIGQVVQNAVPINSLHNKASGVTGTYAMAAYAADDSGREFVAIVTVEERDGSVADIEAYDVTHSISGRQKRSKQADTKSQGV